MVEATNIAWIFSNIAGRRTSNIAPPEKCKHHMVSHHVTSIQHTQSTNPNFWHVTNQTPGDLYKTHISLLCDTFNCSITVSFVGSYVVRGLEL